MRTLIAVVAVAALFTVVFVGCGKNEPAAPATPPAAPAAPAPAPGN